tara:strand:- start:33 stop:554 length:522 start_codon:yes stop_codon:yes gene_type:complete
MKNLLIISTTKNSNLELSEDIKFFLDKENKFNSKIVVLEDFNLPLYNPTIEMKFREKSSFPESILEIKRILSESYAVIWCSPEYNGGIAPVVTNSISWISRVTDDWKQAFNKKKMLICTSSGGNGNNFITGFKLQLAYLGAEIFENSIISTKKKKYDREYFEKVLTDFCRLLN